MAASPYIADKTYEKINFTEAPLAQGEYEHCVFINCAFSNSNLSGIVFVNCEFTGCDLSLVKMDKTALREIQFSECKLLGVHFESCNDFLFSVNFRNCTLNHSSFYKRNLKKSLFKNCSLQELDFTEADLTGSTFENCDLFNTTFENTILEKADLRTSYNYIINPLQNKIRKAKFSLQGATGLLAAFDVIIDEP